jgi:hypothetical protein
MVAVWGASMGDKLPISPDNTMSHDVPEMVTREEVEQLLEAQKTAILQSLTVSLRTAPDAVKPFRVAIEEMEKVHHRGLAQPAQYHGKHRVGRIKAVSMADIMRDKPPCPSENASDETGHADIESDVARFRDTVFGFTPATMRPRFL